MSTTKSSATASCSCEQLRGARPECVFDVGANLGDWSLHAAKLCPQAAVHAFEIVPETAQALADRVRDVGARSITVNALGLSDVEGTVPVAFLRGFSEGSSAAVVRPVGQAEWVDCPVRTGDAYCAERRIERIDLLKLDVEGLERRVLDGFAGMLSRAAVGAVQFEYGRINASIRVLLGDFYELFEGYGYVVGKIYPDGVEFRAFNPWRDENFRGPNYLAVHRDKRELIEDLRSTDR